MREGANRDLLTVFVINRDLLTVFVIGTRKRPLNPHLFINRDKGQMVL